MKLYILLTVITLSLASLHADIPQLSREELKEDLVIGVARKLTEESLILRLMRTMKANNVEQPAQVLKTALPHVPNAYARKVFNIMYGDFLALDRPLTFKEREDFFRRETLWESYLELRDNTTQEMTEFEVRQFLGELYGPFFDHLHSDKGIEIFKNLVQPGEANFAHSIIQHFIDYESKNLDRARKQMRDTEKFRWTTALVISAGTGALVTAITLPFQMQFPVRTPGLVTNLVDLSFLALRIGAAGITGYEAYWRAFQSESMRLNNLYDDLQTRILAFEGLRDRMKGIEAQASESPAPKLSGLGCMQTLGNIGNSIVNLFSR